MKRCSDTWRCTYTHKNMNTANSTSDRTVPFSASPQVALMGSTKETPTAFGSARHPAAPGKSQDKLGQGGPGITGWNGACKSDFNNLTKDAREDRCCLKNKQNTN